MSILENEDFDKAVAGAASRLQAVLAKRRGEGLSSAEKRLEAANLAILNRDQLVAFAESIQQPIIATATDASNVTDKMSEEQDAIANETRKTAVETWDLDAEPTFDGDDERFDLATQNTAGAFLILRDNSMAQSIAQRFADTVIEQRREAPKEKSAWARFQKDQKADLFTLFSNPWGEKAEKHYWTLTCSAWMNKTRNFSIAASFEDSGMEWCRVAAEIDERTTHICRFLHMKRVLVSSVQASEANTTAPTSTGNWIAETPVQPAGGEGTDADKPLLLLPPVEPGGKPRPLAQRTEKHFPGQGDLDMGKYNQFVSDAELAVTLGPPPYHFLCRTLLVPDDFEDPLGLQADVTQTTIPAGVQTTVDNL